VEARAYFSALAKHKKEFKYEGEEDDKALKMAFSKEATSKAKDAKNSADIRKEWIDEYKPGTYLDQSKAKIPIKDFVYKELVLYSIENCQRSIPSLVDGFKPGQRKILYSCFKRNLTKGLVCCGLGLIPQKFELPNFRVTSQKKLLITTERRACSRPLWPWLKILSVRIILMFSILKVNLELGSREVKTQQALVTFIRSSLR
jgi:hypothetical protein